MKNFSWKSIIPHAIAVAVFLIITLLYCLPALKGKVLEQHDTIQWKGMAEQSLQVQKNTGDLPLWNVSMFSGMPNYQIALEGKSILINFQQFVLLGLPKPANFFFLACLCFYFLLVAALQLRPVTGIFGALAFAFATYNPVIISAGHDTKMMAISYMPALLGGLIMIFDKRYIAGIMATAYFASYQISSNHYQISYYLILVLTFMTTAYLIRWIKAGEYRHMVISLSLAALGGGIGIANNAIILMTTQEYGAATMRGGKKVLIDEKGQVEKTETSGLDKDYALSYSIYKKEALVQLMPEAFGGSSSQVYSEDDQLVQKFSDLNVPAQVASQLPRYWGGLESTAGPAYLGALVCLICAAGVAFSQNKHKWWILASVALSLFIAWGKYFEGFAAFMLSYMPLANKFRAPSMALIICQLVMPLFAAITLQEIWAWHSTDKDRKQEMKKILYGIGGLALLVLLVYISGDYSAALDTQVKEAFSNPQQGGNESLGMNVVNALKESRKDMFFNGFLRTLGFGLLTAAALWALLKKQIQPLYIVLGLAAINTIDLLVVDRRYLNADNYRDIEEQALQNFTPSAADQLIKQDTTMHYRVFNTGGDRFAETRTSFFHKSIGGYHAAKLRTYQDLTEKYLSGRPAMNIINMLNGRWILVQGQQPNEPAIAQQNPEAYGNAWFTNNLVPVADEAVALTALEKVNKEYTVVYQKNSDRLKAVTDSGSSIRLTRFSNDIMEYESNSASGGLGVFSEIYYDKGWTATVDGKETAIYPVNYLLRGIMIPAGNHRVVFTFRPDSFYSAQTILYAGNVLLWIVLLGGAFLLYRNRDTIEIATAK